MERKVTTEEAETQFGTILRGVCKEGDDFVVEQDGEPVAAVVPFWLYNQWKRRREGLFARLAEAAQTGEDLTDEETMDIAVEAVRAVREEARRGKSGSTP